jgi:hypothetical protein
MIREALYRAGVTSVIVGHRSPAAWPIKTSRRCDHCGSQFGALNPWHWPPDSPTRTIWLHERCEAPWYDSNGLSEGVQ